MSLSDRSFKAMHKKLVSGTGFSANSKTGRSPKTGFMVSFQGHEEQHKEGTTTFDTIKSFAQHQAEHLEQSDRFIGGWNGDKGEVSIDVSQNIKPNPKVARKYGRDVADADAREQASTMMVARNQESVYDVKRDSFLNNDQFDPKGRRGNV